MATVTKPIALDESLNTTENSPRNIADVLADELGNLISAVSRIAPTTVYDELDKLTDVDITSPTNGQVLKYNSTSQKWENGTDSGAVITLTVSCDSAFQGETVSITKGLTTFTETVGAGLSVSFTVPELGTWTISNSLNSNTDTIEINYYGNYTYSLIAIPDGSTITPTDDIQTLLHCANIWDKSYTTLSELLADTTTLSAVIGSNNAIDYLVRSTTWASDMCADSTAMSYIGLNNYASNTLLADSTWCNAICNSTYFESVLNVKVPTMTSNTTPSGVCFTNAPNSEGAYMAFNDSLTSVFWSNSSQQTDVNTNIRIGYHFTQAVKIFKASLTVCGNTSLVTASPKNCKVQYSTDGTNFTDVANSNFVGSSTTSATVSKNITPPTQADYWALFCLDNYGYAKMIIGEIQFYGRADV